jgi:phage terminase Nu1 subunit (DNA packaging protein)
MHGVDVRTIRRWDEEGHPKNADATYTASESIAWRLQRESGSDLDYTAERARLAKAQADKTEIENAVRAGQLLDASRVVREVGDMLSAFRARVIAIPSAVGQYFSPDVGPVVVGELRTRLYEALAELSEYRPSVPADAGEDPVAAAGADGEPVGGREAPPIERKQRRTRTVAN